MTFAIIIIIIMWLHSSMFNLNFNKHVLEFFQLLLELVTSRTGEFANSHLGRLRLSYASNSRNPRATRVPIEQPRSLEHVTIFDLD